MIYLGDALLIIALALLGGGLLVFLGLHFVASAVWKVGDALDALARTVNVAEQARVQLGEGEKIAQAINNLASPIETIVAELQQIIEEERAAKAERGLR